MSGYNGWANYETWRVNLEMVDGRSAEDFDIFLSEDTDLDDATEALAERIEEFCVELVEMDAKLESFSHNLAMEFISRVDWEEIAQHLITDAQ